MAGVKAGIMAGIFLVILGCAGCGEGRQNAHPALYLHISLPQDLES